MPTLGALPVQAIDRALLIQALERDGLWRKPVLGLRVRTALEGLFDWARVRNLYAGTNPATLAEIDAAIPGREKKHKPKHREAMPYLEVPAFLAAVRQYQIVELKALEEARKDNPNASLDVSPFLIEFLVLTATRLKQCRFAQWQEIDFAGLMWHCPPAHTKNSTEHNIPLCNRANALLHAVQEAMPFRSKTDLIFPGIGGRNVLQGRNTSLRYLRGKLGRSESIHGFRSSFKLWATKTTGPDGRRLFPRELAELALHHTIAANSVELAYLRPPDGVGEEDFREERRPFMAAWATFCDTPVEPAKKTADIMQLAS
jgi:integrase